MDGWTNGAKDAQGIADRYVCKYEELLTIDSDDESDPTLSVTAREPEVESNAF